MSIPLIDTAFKSVDAVINEILDKLLPISWRSDKDEYRKELQENGTGKLLITLKTLLYSLDVFCAFLFIEPEKLKDGLIKLRDVFHPITFHPTPKLQGELLQIGQLLLDLGVITAEELERTLEKQDNGDYRRFGKILAEQTSIHEDLVDYIERGRKCSEARLSINIDNIRSLFVVLALLTLVVSLIAFLTPTSRALTTSLFNCLQAQLLLFAVAASLFISSAERISKQFRRKNYSVHWHSLAIGLYLLFLQTLVPIDEALEYYFDVNPIINYLWSLIPLFLIAFYFPSLVEIIDAIHNSKITRKHRFIGGFFISITTYCLGSIVCSYYFTVGQALQVLGLAIVSCCLILYIKERIKESGACLKYKI